ncbi:MAG TPA: hypothetical protein VN922_15920, partial [Bacteroidia bacterium]|nr:hypothetical protein [Bacteroidia bacterium]
MTEVLRPPVAGGLNAPLKYISGYASRQRNGVGQSIFKLLTRFFEFATACGVGNGAYTLSE